MSEVSWVQILVGVLSNVVDVFEKGRLDVPGRRFSLKETTAGLVSAKTSQQKLLGEELIMFLNRKHTGLTV